MPKAVAKQKAEEKKKSSASPQSAFEQAGQIYRQEQRNAVAEARRLQQAIAAQEAKRNQLDTLSGAQQYYSTVEAYRQRLAQLGRNYGFNVTDAVRGIGTGAAQMASALQGMTQADYLRQIRYPQKYANMGRTGTTDALERLRQQAGTGKLAVSPTGITRNPNARPNQTGTAMAKAEYNWLKQHQYESWSESELRTALAQSRAVLESISGKHSAAKTNAMKQNGVENLNDLKNQISAMESALRPKAYSSAIAELPEKLQRDLLEKSGQWQMEASRKGKNNASGMAYSREAENNLKYLRQSLKNQGLTNAQIESMLDYGRREYNARQQAQTVQGMSEYAKEHPVLASAGSVATNLLGGGIGYADMLLQRVRSGEDAYTGGRTPVDYNSGAQTLSNMSSAVRGTVGEMASSGKLGDFGGFLYQTGMSIADSGVSALTGRILGVPNLAETLLSGSAAQQAAQEAHRRGATDRQALWSGFTAGAAEALFEHISLENLRSIREIAAAGQLGGKAFWKSVGVQALTEGSEEGFTTIANTITDAIIMGDQNQISQQIQTNMLNGMDERDAIKSAWTDWIGQVALDVAGGMLSGSVMGTAGGGIGQAQNRFADRRLDRAIGQLHGAQNADWSKYGAQARAVETIYNLNPSVDAETFQRQFDTAYDLGRSGAEVQTAMETTATADLSPEQRRNAWLIGRDTGIREGTITEETGTQQEVTEHGEAVRVRGSGQRNAGAGAAGSVQQVEGSAGSFAEGRQIGVGEGAADSAAAGLRYSEKKVSARDLGVDNGAVIENLRTVDERSYTPEMKQFAEEQASQGHKVTYVSGLIHAQDGHGGNITKARGMVNQNGDIFVQVDHQRFTAMQIARHEDTHTKIRRGEIDLGKAKESVKRTLGEEAYRRAVQDYAEAYAGIDMTEDEIWEEIVCDAEGGMNIFEGTSLKQEYARNAEITGAARQAVRETQGEGRAGTENGRKMSRETDEYEVYNSRAVISEETLDLWLSGSYFGSTNPNYAQAYIAYMTPDAFLNLTTRDRAERAVIYDRASGSKTVEGTVQQSKRQPIQLIIDHKTGKISGHEGRHRMVALMRAGVRDVPVLLFDSSNKYSKTPIDALELTGQFNRFASESVQDLQPFSQGNRETLIEKYVKPTSSERIGEKYGGRKTVKFSRELDDRYMQAVESGDVETAQRMVDEAARKAGYDSPKLYHGTNAFGFTVIDTRKSNDRISFFATDSAETAGSYSGTSAAREIGTSGDSTLGIYQLYANTDGMLELDAGGEESGHIALGSSARDYNDTMNTKSWNSYATAKQIAKYAKRRGYTGVVIRDVIDSATPESRKALPPSNVYVFFNPQEQVKSADPVTYDGDGNIIPLSERFDSEQTDIRFSKESDTLESLAKENQALRKETVELVKQVAKWKGETKRTTRLTLREQDVRKAAKQMLKDYSSTTKADEILPKLQRLGELILNGENGEQAHWSDVQALAEEIADDIVGGEQVNIRGDVFNEYQQIRDFVAGKTLYLDPASVGDLQGFENMAEFNRRSRGQFILTKDKSKADLTVEDAYYEMAEVMPGWFPEDVNSDAEMAQRMLEVLDGLKPVYGMSDETSYHYDEAVAWAANDIVDRLLDESVRQNPKTFADRAQAKLERTVAQERDRADARVEKARQTGERRLERQRDRFAERINRMREQGEAKLERTKRQYADRSQRAMDRMRERQERQIQRLKERQAETRRNERERREENAGIQKYRKRVERTVKTLTEWLQVNSDKEHVPEALKKPLAEFLSTIDFTSKQALRGGEQTAKDRAYLKRLEALQKVLTTQVNYQNGVERAEDIIGGYLDLQPEYFEQMQAHIDTVKEIFEGTDVQTGIVNRMSAAELQDLDHLLTTLKHAIQNINKLTENARYQSLTEAAKDTMEELAPIREDGGENSKLRSFFMWDNTTPYYAFKRFGKAAASIFEALQNGWDKFAFNVQEIMEFTRKTYTTKQVREWARQTHDFTLESGERVTMTPAQIMSLYELVNREQAVQHMQGGGVRISNIERKGKKTIQQTAHYHFSERDLQQIFGTLTAEQKKVANDLQKYMQDRGSEWGNEVSMKRYGYNAFGEAHYFPIATEGTVRDIKDPGEENNGLYRLLNISATKSLNVNANNALIVRDIFDVFADHMTDMAKYNALALPILDATKWINYRERADADNDGFETRTVQRSIERAFGENALRYYTTFMKDLNGKRESTGRGEDLPRKMISNYKVAAVGANLRVVLLQPTAYVRAIYAINGRHLSIAPFIPGALKEMDKYSGIAVWKSLGYYDTNIARGVREQIKDAGGFKERLQEASMKGAELGDRLTWGAIWNACKLDVKARNKSLEGEALMQATAEKFREVVYSTQVVDSTMTRSHNMRATSLFGSMATAFMAEPTLSYNLVLDAYSEYSKAARITNKSEAWKKTKGRFAKAFTVYTVSALASAIVESIADAFRDDDEYENFMQKFMEALLGEPGFKGRLNSNLVNDLLIFNKLPIIKDALSILSGYGADRLDVEWISNLLKAYGAIKEKIQLSTGELEQPTKTTYFGKMTWYGAVFLGLKTLSQASGLPVSALTREAVTIWNSTVGAITGQKVKTYEPSAKSQIEKGLENGYLSEEDAVRLLVQEGVADDENKAYFMVQEMTGGGKKYDAIMEAVTSGDRKAFDAALKDLKDHGVKEKTAISAVKSGIGDLYKGKDDEEPSITEAQALKMLQDFAGMKADEAEKTVNAWTAKRETGLDSGDIKDAYLDGDLTRAEVISMRTKYMGDTPEEAEEYALKLDCEKKYGVAYGEESIIDAAVDGEIDVETARKIWSEYGGIEGNELENRITKLQFVVEHPGASYEDVSVKAIKGYNDYGKAAQISADAYMSYFAQMDTYTSDYDANGKTIKGQGKMNKVFAYLSSLDIPPEQKTALALSMYAQSTVVKNKTW